MKRRARAQCPACPGIYLVRTDGRLPIHGPKRQRCEGSEVNTDWWNPAETPEGLVCFAPRNVTEMYRPARTTTEET